MKESILKDENQTPANMPVDNINKFTTPQSKRVLNPPTKINLANCRATGIFLAIISAMNNPTIERLTRIKQRINKLERL